jgi:hypothetical protein
MRLVPQQVPSRQGGMALLPAFPSENVNINFSTVLAGYNHMAHKVQAGNNETNFFL